MNIKYRAYALIEVLVIIVMVVVIMSLSVRPLRTMLSEIPRSVRICQSLNVTTAALGQIQDDIEKSTEITGLNNGTLALKHDTESITYRIADGQITRHPGLHRSDGEYTWKLPHVKIEIHLWNQDEQPYAVELTTWNQQNALGRDDVRFKQTAVFFKKGQQR